MIGQNLARCWHCGKQWTVGDCIPGICPECIESGHTEEGPCLECEKRFQESEKKISCYPDNCEHCGEPIIKYTEVKEQKCPHCENILSAKSYQELKGKEKLVYFDGEDGF